MGITLNISWGEPEDNSTANIDAAERSMQFAGGWFANPIWGPNGDYPQVMIDQVLRLLLSLKTDSYGKLLIRLAAKAPPPDCRSLGCPRSRNKRKRTSKALLTFSASTFIRPNTWKTASSTILLSIITPTRTPLPIRIRKTGMGKSCVFQHF